MDKFSDMESTRKKKQKNISLKTIYREAFVKRDALTTSDYEKQKTKKQKRPQKTIGNCLDDKLSDY